MKIQKWWIFLLVATCMTVCMAEVKPDKESVAKAPFDAKAAKDYQELAARHYGVPLEKSADLGNGVKMEFVLIPAGEFHMGSPSAEGRRRSDEGPAHHVKISKPFYLGKFEVTQLQYKAIFGDTAWSAKNYAFKGDNLPVENVKWYEADRFFKEMSHQTGLKVRFPTEAEWEYACRAGTVTPFYTGQTISSDDANYDASRTYGTGVKGLEMKKTVDAGSYPPNGFGLYDMHGNVWEWCSDWYRKHYYRESVVDDPKGPASGKKRVTRGGSWKSWPKNCRSADRNKCAPSKSTSNTGFRVVLELEQ